MDFFGVRQTRDDDSWSESSDSFDFGNEGETRHQDTSIEKIPLELEKVASATGIQVPILRKFCVQTVNRKKSKSRVTDKACDTLTYAITVYVTRILERAVRIAKLRTQGLESDDVCVSGVPSLGFALLNAEQNPKQEEMENEVSECAVHEFVESLHLEAPPFKLPHDTRHLNVTKEVVDVLPRNKHESGVSVYDVMHVVECDQCTSLVDLQATKVSLATKRMKE